MTPLRMAAVTCVTTALALYTVGCLKEQRARRATRGVVGFLTVAVVFDVVATGLMVLATRSADLTLHGALGYSALGAMLLDTVLLWRHRLRAGEAEVPRALHRYSRIAWAYWVAAYFTGAALVMGSRAAS
uniref:DUF420 domain-containing protein n=1 Tax=Eiseniibacteriota bacterium TaxID=2212470 RepID=A0A832I7C6_UNCEI